MIRPCTLAMLTILISSLPALAEHDGLHSSLALSGPALENQVTPASPVVGAPQVMAQPMTYSPAGHYGARADCGCGEYFGGFGPLWSGYCYEGRGCGWRTGCGPACGAAACCGPTCGSRWLRHRRWRASAGMAVGKGGAMTKGCDCGASAMGAVQAAPTDIGQPPGPAPAPAPDAVEPAEPAPAADAEAALEPDQTPRRRWWQS